jgi:hypothetical protein
MKNKFLILVIIATVLLLVGMGAPAVLAAQVDDSVNTTYVITPDNLQGWAFYYDSPTTRNRFMLGPGIPPLGTGSVRLQIDGPGDGYIMYKAAWGGTLLSDITALTYSTYQDNSSSGDVTQLPALLINVDYDLTDLNNLWQGQLVYEPYKTPSNTPVKGAWQTWDTLIGKWWATDAPGNVTCPQSTPCDWSALKAAYPSAGVYIPTPGIGFKVGNGWENGFIGNVDNFVITYGGISEVYNFESGNNPPVAYNQSVSTPEDTPKAITLTAYDAEGSPLTWTVVSPPAHGALTGTAPALTYTPAANYNGPDSFTFKVRDGTLDSTPATISITVTPVNDAPIANDQSITTAEDTPKAITLTASDVDGDPLTWSIVTPPAHGALTGTAPALTYTPAANYNGTDSFTFRVFDGTVYSNIATVTITVTPVNDAPVANAQSVTTAEDTPKAITLTASDVDGDPLTWSIVTPPAHGALTGTAPTLTYTPAANYNGPDSFTFRVFDGTVFSNIATVTITVTPVNDAPVANDQSVTTAENTAKAITLTASDVDNDPLTWSIVTPPAHGALTGTAPALTYTPAANYSGPDSFTFRVFDGTVFSNIATVTITVTSINHAPTLNPIGNKSGKALTLISFTATATDPDIPVNTLTFSLDAGAPSGASINATTGAFTWTPTEAQGPGVYPVTVRVTDNGTPALSDFETIQITVAEKPETYYFYVPIIRK